MLLELFDAIFTQYRPTDLLDAHGTIKKKNLKKKSEVKFQQNA